MPDKKVEKTVEQKAAEREVRSLKREHSRLQREIHSLQNQFRGKLVVLVTGAFTLVAALSWNDLFKTVLAYYFPNKGGILPQLVAAVVVTTVAVLGIWLVSKLGQPKDAAKKKK